MKLLKKNNKPVTQENQYLLQEIALTKRALSAAYSNFDNATDPDLIDCYIYQVNSEQKRYKYLLQKAKEYEKLQSNVVTAARRGYVDLIIEPADTRKYLVAAFESICQYLFLYF